MAVQYCAGFWHASTRISRRYTHVPSLWNLPPTLHPSRPLVVTEHRFELPASCSKFPLAVSFPCGHVHASRLLSPFNSVSLLIPAPNLSLPNFPFGIHPSVCVCESVLVCEYVRVVFCFWIPQISEIIWHSSSSHGCAFLDGGKPPSSDRASPWTPRLKEGRPRRGRPVSSGGQARACRRGGCGPAGLLSSQLLPSAVSRAPFCGTPSG